MVSTIDIKKVEELYKQNKYYEALEKCAEYIASMDIDDFNMFDQIHFCYKHMFNCYYALEDEKNCREVLKIWVRYTRNNEDYQYTVFWNIVRLDIVTGRSQESLDLLEQCINRYKSKGMTKAVASLYFMKGMATNDIKYYKEAIELFRKAGGDVEEKIEKAKRKIKELRHLK